MPLFRSKKKIDYISLVKASNPIAYYPLTETAAGTATDMSGYGRHMVIGSNVQFVTSASRKQGGGVFNDATPSTAAGDSATSFATMKTYAVYGYEATYTNPTALYTAMVAATSSAPRTYEAWLDGLGGWHTNPSGGVVISVGRAALGTQFLKDNHDTISVFGKIVTLAAFKGLTTAASSIPATGWFHLVAVYKPTAEDNTTDLDLYINGVKYTTAYLQTLNDVFQLSEDKGVTLLGSPNSSNTSVIGKGAIAHAAFYDKALSPAEIALHYEYGKNG